MATVGAVGGSQIDVASLVSQLVAAERAPLDTQISRESGRVTTQISALGSLMGSLSSFRGTLASLNTVDVFSTRTATSSDEEIFTVAASAKSVPGSYQIDVQQLAKAQQLSSDPFTEGSTEVVGTGTLTLTLGEESFSLTIDDSNSTLADIRDAINSATDNPGVRATLVSGTDGSRLVLTSASTGADSTITVAQTGGDGGLARLEYSPSATGNYTQLVAAQDAIVNIAGAETRSSANTISDAIDGVTLTLLDESEEPVTLTVGYDQASVTTRINNFVSAYNSLMTQISSLRSYNSITETAGPLMGDSLLSSIESQIRRTITSPVEGVASGYNTLASIGITTQANGTLAVDDTKLQKALNTNFEAVGKLFGSENGVGAQLYAQVEDRLKTGGAIDTRSKNLVNQQQTLSKRQDDVDARMEALETAYIRQFTALDTLLSQLQVTSSYLTQQIEALGNLNAASSS